MNNEIYVCERGHSYRVESCVPTADGLMCPICNCAMKLPPTRARAKFHNRPRQMQHEMECEDTLKQITAIIELEAHRFQSVAADLPNNIYAVGCADGANHVAAAVRSLLFIKQQHREKTTNE